MGFTNIRLERDEAVATVSVCRPDKLNALNDATLSELTQAFTELRDDQGVRCVILTGGEAKRPAFVAGADIAEPLNVADITDFLSLLAAWGEC